MKSSLQRSPFSVQSRLSRILNSPSKMGLGLALAALAIVLPACDSSQQASDTVNPEETTATAPTDSDQYVGQTVAVSGEVTEVYSPDVFTLQADNNLDPGGQVLVLVTDSTAAGTTGTGAGTGTGGTGATGTGTDTGAGTTGDAAGTSTGDDTGTAGTGAATGTGTDTSGVTATLDQGETVQLTGQVERFDPAILQGQYGLTLDDPLISQIQQNYTGEYVIISSAVDQTSSDAPNNPSNTTGSPDNSSSQ